MVRGTVSVQKMPGKTPSVLARLNDLARTDVLVGIPQEKADRGDGTLNNAERLYILSHGVRKKEMRDAMQPDIDAGMKYSAAFSLYIQSHGSPLWQIPPRPVLEPAIADRKPFITNQLKEASLAALHGNADAAEASLNKAGMLGADAAKGWFENPKNNWPPNSPKTIAAKGSDSPLIDTGAMRKAITYVMRKK